MFKLITLKPMRSKAFVHYFRISHLSMMLAPRGLSAVVSFRAFQIPCLAIQTLILNFALLVIRFLLLHSIPQWIYLLYHLTHVFIHKFVSMPSYWNCLNLGNLITFQCVYLLTYNLHYLNVRYVASCVLFSISCRLYCYASDLHSLNTHSVIIKLVCVC